MFERYEPDDVTLRLPFRDDLTNDGTYFHGGVIASVMDIAGAGAAWSNHPAGCTDHQVHTFIAHRAYV